MAKSTAPRGHYISGTATRAREQGLDPHSVEGPALRADVPDDMLATLTCIDQGIDWVRSVMFRGIANQVPSRFVTEEFAEKCMLHLNRAVKSLPQASGATKLDKFLTEAEVIARHGAGNCGEVNSLLFVYLCACMEQGFLPHDMHIFLVRLPGRDHCMLIAVKDGDLASGDPTRFGFGDAWTNNGQAGTLDSVAPEFAFSCSSKKANFLAGVHADAEGSPFTEIQFDSSKLSGACPCSKMVEKIGNLPVDQRVSDEEILATKPAAHGEETRFGTSYLRADWAVRPDAPVRLFEDQSGERIINLDLIDANAHFDRRLNALYEAQGLTYRGQGTDFVATLNRLTKQSSDSLINLVHPLEPASAAQFLLDMVSLVSTDETQCGELMFHLLMCLAQSGLADASQSSCLSILKEIHAFALAQPKRWSALPHALALALDTMKQAFQSIFDKEAFASRESIDGMLFLAAQGVSATYVGDQPHKLCPDQMLPHLRGRLSEAMQAGNLGLVQALAPLVDFTRDREYLEELPFNAAYGGHWDMVDALLNCKGIDPYHTHMGKSLYQLAKSQGNSTVSERLAPLYDD